MASDHIACGHRFSTTVVDEIPGRLDQRLIRRRLAQIGCEIARDSLGSAALHECGEAQAALDVAQCIKARSFYRSAGQVNVGHGFVAGDPWQRRLA